MAQYTLGSVLLFKDSSTVYGSEATDWSGVDAICIFSVAGAYFQLASPSSQIAMTSFVSYDQAVTYSRGDLARHGGKYYVARRSTVGEVPTINSQAWMPTSRWSLTLNTPCPLDDQVALYAIHKDFTPNLSLPLVRPTDRNAIALLGRAMMQLDTYSGRGTGGSTEGAWTLVRNPNDYLQSFAVGATGRCIQCETGNVGQVGGLPWAWVGVVPAMSGVPVSPAYIYILRADSRATSHHAYARVHVTGALEIIEHGDSVDDYCVWRIADFVDTWLAEARAMQIACAPGVHPVVQVLNGATWTTVAGVEESVGTAPAWGLATLSTGQHVQAYDWPAGRCPLGAVLIGTALAANELAAWAASGRWPYWVEAGGSAVSVPVGALTLGRRYYIAEYTAGDDFTNCGAASNATGVSFIATAASPAVWAGSRLVAAGAVSIPQIQSGVAALPDTTENNKAWGLLGLVKAVGRAAVIIGTMVIGGECFELFDDYAPGDVVVLSFGGGWLGTGTCADHSGYVGNETFEDYAAGDVSTLAGGSGFAATGTLLDLSFNSGTETFEGYDTGDVSTLAGGSGFAGPATLTLYTE